MSSSARSKCIIAAAIAFSAVTPGWGQTVAPPLEKMPVAAPNATEAEQSVRAYSVPAASIDEMLRKLNERFPAGSGVRFIQDPRTAQILVVGPAAVQEQAAALFQANNGVATQPLAQPNAAQPNAAAPQPTLAAPPQMQAGAPPAANRGPKVVPLRNLSYQAFEAELNAMFGRALPVTEERGGDWARYNLETRNGRVSLIVDRKAGQVALEGPVKLADAWARVVESLDAQPRQGDNGTRVVPLNQANTADVVKALSVFRNASASGGGDAASAAAGQKREGAGNMINMIFQPRAGADNAANAMAQAQVPPQEALDPNDPNYEQLMQQRQAEQAAQESQLGTGGELVGPVQIEFLEGLDVIVVKGNPADVERVMKIIAEIEQLSAVSQPKIEIYPLKFVSGQSLAPLVLTLYDQTFMPRQGRVSVTALGKPNSLLLIGRPEGVAQFIELVKRLDQPANPNSMYQVFPLKNATAAAAQVTVQQFFTQRVLGTGLQGSASVIADTRNNSLIVQASPRDLQEVGALIKTIDSDAGSNKQVIMRIFQLRNSVADELAQILTNSLADPTQVRTGAQGQQGQQGQQGGGGFGQQGGGFGQQGGGFGQQGGQQGGGFGQQQGGAGGGNQQAQAANQRPSVNIMLIDPSTGQRLRSGLVADIRITSDPRANTLLVTAPAQSMELIAALINQLDQLPNAESSIKVFGIVNGDAQTLVLMLQTLFGQQRVTTVGGGGGGAGGQAGPIQVEDILVPVRFSVDQRTNSIIASGSSKDLAVVEAILLKLDESDVRARKNMIYRLKNVFAPNVATTLTQFLTQVRQLQQLEPTGVANPFEEIEREVVVVAEIASNSLIVSATPRYFDEMQRIIEQIDRRPPMVMIQVLIAEVALNNTDEFGVELGLQDSVLFDRSLVGANTFITRNITTTLPNGTQTTTNEIVGADQVPGFNFNNQPLGNSASTKALQNSGRVGSQGVSSFGVGRINNSLGYGGLVLSASSESVSALLRALSECRRVDVLTRPQIMTMDNQAAFLQVGQRVPRIVSTNITTAGTINQTTLDNVGILLQVQPRVSPDNLIVIYVDAEKSELGPEAEGIPISINTVGEVIRSPIYNTTLAQTTVQAVEGQTVVLGGLITTRKEQTHRRVPFLANIPLVGNLFRYDLTAQRRTELLIVLTPHIVRSEADADRIKQTEAARMSWCLGDVIKLNGPSGLRTRNDDFTNNETVVVYPELNADGTPKPVEHDLMLKAPEEIPSPGRVGPMLRGGGPQPGPTPARPPVPNDPTTQ